MILLFMILVKTLQPVLISEIRSQLLRLVRSPVLGKMTKKVCCHDFGKSTLLIVPL